MTFDDFKAWLERHGIDVEKTRSIEIVPLHTTELQGVYLKVMTYPENENGQRMVNTWGEILIDTRHVKLCDLP